MEQLQTQHLADTRLKKILDQSKTELQLSLKSQELSYQEKTARLQKTCKFIQDSCDALEVLIKVSKIKLSDFFHYLSGNAILSEYSRPISSDIF